MNTFPVSNRPQDLQIDFFYIQRMVGNFLKYGYNSSTWDDEQTQVVQEIIDEGVRQFYFPPVLEDGVVHEWTFMRPTIQIVTEASQRRYPLPSDWERPVGNLCYTDTSNDFYAPIQFTAATRLRNLEYQDNFLSYPQYAAIEPAESQGDAPQLLVLVLHPTPDAQYELTVQYQAHARRLTKEHPYPLGGQANGPVLLASCLSIAEFRKSNIRGPMHDDFKVKLSTAAIRDTKRGATLLGYNGNGGGFPNGRGSARSLGGLYYNLATYGGSEYSGD